MKRSTKNTIIFSTITAVSSIILGVLIFLMIKFDSADMINRIVGAIAIITGLSSLIMGISSIFSATLDNVREYFYTGDTVEHSSARKLIYSYRDLKMTNGISIETENFNDVVKNLGGDFTKEELEKVASLEINFFQMWGLLQSKHYLPMWVFDTASGYSIVKLFEGVQDIIEYKRKYHNPNYADQFIFLYKKILKRYSKEISECRLIEQQPKAEKDITKNESAKPTKTDI